jgi:hypothetical protein
MVGACASGGGDAAEVTTTTAAGFADIEAAAELVGAGATAVGLTSTDTETLVQATCDASGAEGGAGTLAARVTTAAGDSTSSTELRSLLSGLGDAAEVYCPDAAAEDPELLNDAYSAGVSMLRPAPATTLPPTPTTAAPTTTAAPAPPPPPPTTAPPPPPPPPPATVAPPPPPSSCDPSYPDVCIPPAPPDLDCGDVPYRRFRVVAPDPHGFDADADGVGCESG